jgi:hypothetical protein
VVAFGASAREPVHARAERQPSICGFQGGNDQASLRPVTGAASQSFRRAPRSDALLARTRRELELHAAQFLPWPRKAVDICLGRLDGSRPAHQDVVAALDHGVVRSRGHRAEADRPEFVDAGVHFRNERHAAARSGWRRRRIVGGNRDSRRAEGNCPARARFTATEGDSASNLGRRRYRHQGETAVCSCTARTSTPATGLPSAAATTVPRREDPGVNRMTRSLLGTI